MKRTLMVVQTLGQAAGLTVLSMASLAGAVFLAYCLVAVMQVTFWGAVLPAGMALFAAFCAFLFASREPERPEEQPRNSAGESRRTSEPEVSVRTLQRIPQASKRPRHESLSNASSGDLDLTCVGLNEKAAEVRPESPEVVVRREPSTIA